MSVTRETRTLPAFAPGPVEMPSTIVSWSENLARDTTWNRALPPVP